MPRSGGEIIGRKRPKGSLQDLYSTPLEVIIALFERERFPGIIWDPACGEGNIVRAFLRAKEMGLIDYPCAIFATDVRDVIREELRTFYRGEKDFLESPRKQPESAQHIITNPPFSIAHDFACQALQETEGAGGKVALFLRINFLETAGRREFLERSPLKKVWCCSRRRSMYPEGAQNRGGGTQFFAWFVWDWNHYGPPTVGWIP